MDIPSKPRFVLIPGGLGQDEVDVELQGPVSRLGLWDRFPDTSPKFLAFIIVSKLLLLGSLAYWVYG